MSIDVSRYMDPDEMLGEHGTANGVESDVMGVTKDSLLFVSGNDLIDCSGCGRDALHPSQVVAIRPCNHAVVMCHECMPDPPEEWL